MVTPLGSKKYRGVTIKKSQNKKMT